MRRAIVFAVVLLAGASQASGRRFRVQFNDNMARQTKSLVCLKTSPHRMQCMSLAMFLRMLAQHQSEIEP